MSVAHPFWNRSGGTDHVFFLTTDRGGCWKPWVLQHSIIISYFGFTAPEAYFGFEERLRWPVRGPNRRNNAYDVRPGSVATELACYDAHKDVVVPVDVALGRREEAKLPRPGDEYACNTRRRVLLFMGGSMQNMGRTEYSQGVRQAIQQLHANETGFVLGGKFALDDLRDSVFCLAPSGWGWGWRLSLAMATQCIPVIIQPNVTQPFETLLPYASFALRFEKRDIARLPQLLRAVPSGAVCRMQQRLARYYRAMLWQQPFGAQHAGAYEVTQIWLCQRARALAVEYTRSGLHPLAFLARHQLACAADLEPAGVHF